MTYGKKAVLPTKIGVPTHRVIYFNEQENNEEFSANLDMLEVGQDDSHMKVVAYQQAAARGYNKKVKVHHFLAGDLVLKKKSSMWEFLNQNGRDLSKSMT